MRLPDFFVIGAQRAGSTSLHYALAQHPGIFLPARKELNYWLRDQDGRLPPWTPEAGVPKTMEEYAALFAGAAPHQKIGEISPGYLSGPVADRIHRHLPGVRIIAVLRHPVDQARSILATWIGHQPTATELRAALDNGIAGPHGDLPLVEHGQYAKHLGPYVVRFPAGRVLVLNFERMTEEPDGTLRRLQEFIGVPPMAIALPHYNQSGVVHRVPGWAKTWAKQVLPSGAVRRISAGLHQLRARHVVPTDDLPASVRRDLFLRYYAADAQRLAELGFPMEWS